MDVDRGAHVLLRRRARRRGARRAPAMGRGGRGGGRRETRGGRGREAPRRYDDDDGRAGAPHARHRRGAHERLRRRRPRRGPHGLPRRARRRRRGRGLLPRERLRHGPRLLAAGLRGLGPRRRRRARAAAQLLREALRAARAALLPLRAPHVPPADGPVGPGAPPLQPHGHHVVVPDRLSQQRRALVRVDDRVLLLPAPVALRPPRARLDARAPAVARGPHGGQMVSRGRRSILLHAAPRLAAVRRARVHDRRDRRPEPPRGRPGRGRPVARALGPPRGRAQRRARALRRRLRVLLALRRSLRPPRGPRGLHHPAPGLLDRGAHLRGVRELGRLRPERAPASRGRGAFREIVA